MKTSFRAVYLLGVAGILLALAMQQSGSAQFSSSDDGATISTPEASDILPVLPVNQPEAKQSAAKPDPQMQLVLDALASLNPKPLSELNAELARQQPSFADALRLALQKQGKEGPEAVGHTENILIPLTERSIDGRIYVPQKKEPSYAVIFYIHGGGWVLGDLDTYDASARALCNATGALVISTDYRHAPEHPFPAAHEDVFDAYQWMLGNIGRWNGDVRRVAVVGESVGGNMAVNLCMMASGHGIALPLHQALIYPVADLTDMNSPSYQEHANAVPLSKAAMEWFVQHTLTDPGQVINPMLSPVLAGDMLKVMPPTTIITAEIDPLRSDGEKLARELEKAGVHVNLENFEGVTHEFFGMGAVVQKADQAVNIVAADIRTSFENAARAGLPQASR